jgi:hypothetical protein
MQTFGLFLLAAGLLSIALAVSSPAGFFAGLCLPIVSLVFWKLDRRARALAEEAETALKELEEEWRGEALDEDPAMLVTRGQQLAEKMTAKRRGTATWNQHFSLATYFACAYWLFGALGLVGCLSVPAGPW